MAEQPPPYSTEFLAGMNNMTREERINGSQNDREIYFILKQRQLEEPQKTCLGPCSWCWTPTGNFCDGTFCVERAEKFGRNMTDICVECEAEKAMCRDCCDRKGTTVDNWAAEAAEMMANSKRTDTAMMQVMGFKTKKH